MMIREPLGVLIVDDDERDFHATRDLFMRTTGARFDVRWARSYSAGLAALATGESDVCFVDYDLEGKPGMDLVLEAQRLGARVPMILLNGHHPDVPPASMHYVDDCLPKWHLTPALLERSARHAVERRRLLDRVADAERRFASLEQHAGVIYFEGDPRTQRLLYVSPAYERILGQSREEACATPRAWVEKVHPDDHERVSASFAVAPYDDIEFRIVRADGGVRWLRRRLSAERDAAGRVVRIVGTAEDVTPLRDAQRHAAASTRLATFGRLVGGVAHDFNNMLTAIICEAEQLKRALATDDPRHSGAQEIIGSSHRAAELARQLLTFGRRRTFEPVEVDLNSVVEGVERTLQRLVGADVTLVTDLTPDVALVMGEMCQLEQVVINLVLNARDAMPSGGRVCISTHVEEEFAVLSVEDEGTGMSDEVRARLFEPFFTTKAPDSGTGLGLCSVRDIVERTGGSIGVESRLGRGSRFNVCLPRAAASDNA